MAISYGNTAQFPPNGSSTAPAAAAPRSPYRHLELCGIALELEKLANSDTFMSRLQAFSNLWQKT